jgi:hypothetical protein
MTDPKKSETETTQSITVETLAAALAQFAKDQRPTAELITGMSEARLDQAQGKHDKPVRERKILGRSSRTGSTFIMIVLESRSPRHPFGRVVRLEEYRLPKDFYVPVAQGGSLPDGALIWLDPKNTAELNDSTPSHLLNQHFKGLRSNGYWLPDLRDIASGNPLRPENCVDPRAIHSDPSKPGAVPWQEGVLWAARDEDAAE